MLVPKTVWAIFHQGKVELLEQVDIPDGTRVLVMILLEEETTFWLQASQSSLEAIWSNEEDDVYAKLLEE